MRAPRKAAPGTSSVAVRQTASQLVATGLRVPDAKITGRKGLWQDAPVRQTAELVAHPEIVGNLEAADPRRLEHDEDVHRCPDRHCWRTGFVRHQISIAATRQALPHEGVH